MIVRAAVKNYLRRRVALWERRRTERYVRNLPFEIQKDIGWPGGENSERPYTYAHNGLLERRW